MQSLVGQVFSAVWPRTGFARLLAPFLLPFLVSIAQASVEDCRVSGNVFALTEIAETLSWSRQDLSLQNAIRLRRALAYFDRAGSELELQDLGSRDVQDAFVNLRRQLQQINQSGRIDNIEEVRKALSRFLSYFEHGCTELAAELKGDGKAPPKGGGVSLYALESVSSGAAFGTHQNLFLLYTGAAGAIVLLIVSKHAYNFYYAFTNVRSKCRITAALEAGLDIVDGYVVLLGRRQCRFKAVNAGAHKRIEDLGAKEPVILVIEHERLAANLTDIGKDYVLADFDRPITKFDVRRLLRLSSVAPEPAT